MEKRNHVIESDNSNKENSVYTDKKIVNFTTLQLYLNSNYFVMPNCNRSVVN